MQKNFYDSLWKFIMMMVKYNIFLSLQKEETKV